jgi:hypothetical protein
MGFQPYPLNKISSSNTDVSQQYQQQTCIDSLQFKKNTHYHTNVNRSIPEQFRGDLLFLEGVLINGMMWSVVVRFACVVELLTITV